MANRTAQAKQTGRPRNTEPRKYMTLMMKRELHQRIKEQADRDGMELLPWIRFACTQELKRRERA